MPVTTDFHCVMVNQKSGSRRQWPQIGKQYYNLILFTNNYRSIWVERRMSSKLQFIIVCCCCQFTLHHRATASYHLLWSTCAGISRTISFCHISGTQWRHVHTSFSGSRRKWDSQKAVLYHETFNDLLTPHENRKTDCSQTLYLWTFVALNNPHCITALQLHTIIFSRPHHINFSNAFIEYPYLTAILQAGVQGPW